MERFKMKKIILALMLTFSGLSASDANTTSEYGTLDKVSDILWLSEKALLADEINIKFASYVKHHFNIKNLNWNEGFKNGAKGIELIKYVDDNKRHGLGLTYITFRNSFDIRTNAGGIVYKYQRGKFFDIKPNIKLYGLYQKGYYGSWNNVKPYDLNSDDKFFTPMVSAGLEYKGFTVDGVGTSDTLSAITFGYSFKLN